MKNIFFRLVLVVGLSANAHGQVLLLLRGRIPNNTSVQIDRIQKRPFIQSNIGHSARMPKIKMQRFKDQLAVTVIQN